MKPLLGLSLCLVWAGCVDPAPAASEAQHRFGGSFTQEATQEQIAEFGRRMREHGGETIVMESFPAQFQVRGFGKTGCEAASAEAKTLAYVATVHACTPVRTGSGPDDATQRW